MGYFDRPMPILSGSVTFARFHAGTPPKAPSEAKKWFSRGLKSHAFEPVDRKSDEDRAVGFVELEDAQSSAFGSSSLFYAERALFSWRVDQLRISAADMKEELTLWQQTFERENDRKVSRTEKNQARARIKDQLRSKARVVSKTYDIAWNLRSGQMQIWTSSRKLVDEIVVALQTGFEVKLEPLVPSTFARRAKIADDALSPTPELVGGEDLEVTRGAA